MSNPNPIITIKNGVTFVITEAFDDRGLSAKVGNVRDYTRVFWVQTDKVVDMIALTGLPPIPFFGDFYTSALGAFDTASTCVEIDVRQRPESPKHFKVECKYSTATRQSPHEVSSGGASGETGGSPAEAKNQTPTLKPPKISFSGTRTKKVVRLTTDGDAIVNSAGFPFDPPLEEDEAHLVIHITRNEAVFDHQTIIDFQDTLNNAQWYNMDEGTVKCNTISAARQYEAGMFFWEVTYEFEYNPDGWDRKVLDCGFDESYLKPDGVTRVRNKIMNGSQPTTVPYPLKDGKKNDLQIDGNNPVFLTFKTKEYPTSTHSTLFLKGSFMADQNYIVGDLYVGGSLVVSGSISLPTGSVTDAAIQPGTNVQASKLEHQYEPTYRQESAVTAATGRQVVHAVKGTTGSLLSFVVGAVTAATSTGTATIDLLKNGTSILSAAVSLDASTAAFILKSGTLASTSLVAGDVLEVNVSAVTGSVLAKGLFARLVLRELAQ